LRSAEEQGAEAPALVARRMRGIVLFQRGEFSASRSCLEQALSMHDPIRHRPLTFQYGADQRSSGLAWLALDLCLLGYTAQAERAAREAIVFAHEIGHTITLAHALRMAGCYLDVVRRDPLSAREHATALKEYSERQRLPYWQSVAKFTLGWTLVHETPTQNAVTQMREALAEGDAVGTRLERPFLLAMMAEACFRLQQAEDGLRMVKTALTTAEETGEYWWNAAIHRLRGELLLSLAEDNAAAAEACYDQAIGIARGQGAKSLELQAATSLARLWQRQGKVEQGRTLLASTFGWFTEGFETPVLKEAKALLDELRS
jgi:predicted ATPase